VYAAEFFGKLKHSELVMVVKTIVCHGVLKTLLQPPGHIVKSIIKMKFSLNFLFALLYAIPASMAQMANVTITSAQTIQSYNCSQGICYQAGQIQSGTTIVLNDCYTLDNNTIPLVPIFIGKNISTNKLEFCSPTHMGGVAQASNSLGLMKISPTWIRWSESGLGSDKIPSVACNVTTDSNAG
jgi:hypothetical protein